MTAYRVHHSAPTVTIFDDSGDILGWLNWEHSHSRIVFNFADESLAPIIIRGSALRAYGNPDDRSERAMLAYAQNFREHRIVCRCCGKQVSSTDREPIHTACIAKHWGRHGYGLNASRCHEFRSLARK